MNRLIGFTLVISLVLLLIVSEAAQAQERDTRLVTDDEVNAIAKQVYCPVCENIPLDACPTLACIQWRELIRELLAQGWSEAEIINYLLEEYGDMVVALPPPRGFNWLLYVIPPTAILAGGLIFFQSLKNSKRIKRPSTGDHQTTEPATDEYINRFEEELRKR